MVPLDGEHRDPGLLEFLEYDRRLGQHPGLDVAFIEEVARDHHEVDPFRDPVGHDDVVEGAEEVLGALGVVVGGGAQVDVGEVQELEPAHPITWTTLRGRASHIQPTARALAPM